MNNNIVFILIICSVSLLLFSCFKSKNKYGIRKNEDTILAKTICFPNTLLKLEGNQFYKSDSFLNEIEGNKRIISIVDITCSDCFLLKIKKTDSIFNTIITDDTSMLLFILNFGKRDSAFFMYNLQPQIKVTGKVLWDDNYNFERQNNLITTDESLRTFMINGENRIIQYGNPLRNHDILREYQEKLKN